jgi:AcrR family transcriptional regulator
MVIIHLYYNMGGEMPKLVDHEARRAEIADVACRLVVAHGVAGITFREVAAAADISVGSIQHYFPNKEALLRRMLEQTSQRMAGRIQKRLSDLGPSPSSRDTIRAVITSFIPDDADSRAAMTVYHSFAGAALTDPALRGPGSFENATGLLDFLSDRLQDVPKRRRRAPDADPRARARALLSLVLGLSLAVLLDQFSYDEAIAALEGSLVTVDR